ncbi:MAG: HNH endonuclease [Bacilli bacterium]|nr:HNH endonuclease [Bacilli bacterium]
MKNLCLNCNNIVNHNAVKFCSVSCEKEYKYKSFIKLWLTNEIDGTTGVKVLKPSKYIYRWFKEQPQKCEICGCSNIWNDKILKLEVDHVNGDRSDSRKCNLRLLCPNCHSQTDTFRNTKRNYD